MNGWQEEDRAIVRECARMRGGETEKILLRPGQIGIFREDVIPFNLPPTSPDNTANVISGSGAHDSTLVTNLDKDSQIVQEATQSGSSNHVQATFCSTVYVPHEK